MIFHTLSCSLAWVPPTVRRSRLFGQLSGRSKLKAGSRLLVWSFPEIKFIASPRHGVRRPVPSLSLIGRGKPRPVFAGRAPDADAADCTKRRDNAHKTEELEVLYPWHPCSDGLFMSMR
jgi:hypothetical protein